MSNLATIVNNILADSGIDDINVVVTNGSYNNPPWITALAWTKITGAPSNIVTGTGTGGQISFWYGTTTQAEDNGLLWNNSSKLLRVVNGGIEINNGSSTGLLYKRGDTFDFSIENSTGDLEFFNYGADDRIMRLVKSTNRVSIGNDPSPTSKLFVRGVGSTSATFSFNIVNSSLTNLLSVRDDGQVSTSGNILMNNNLVATQSWVNSQGFVTGGPFAALNGNTSNSFGVLELTYAATTFNPAAAPRTTLSPMSIKMWNNYFNGTGLGSDYGTVMEYYSLSGHVDTQVYFDAGGGSWYRSASYAAGWQAWREYITSANIGSQSVSFATTAGSITGQANSATITAATAATANTIVLRDGSGDIYSRYSFSAYVNTSDNDEGGITRFVIKNGDNYHRSATTTVAADIIRGVASGTWGINITGNAGTITSQANSATITAAVAATANTIALRDGNGDITVRELIMNVAVQNFTPSSLVAIYPATNQAVKVDAPGARAFLNVPTRTGGDASGTWEISITGNADTVDGFHAAQIYTITANEAGSFLGGHYSSGGNEKPNSATFGAGKLKLAMLSGSNLGYGGSWNDVLWLSSYNGGDVKSSHALVFDKYSTNVWVSDQNFDSASWGTGYLLLHSGNFNSYAPALGGAGAFGTWEINITGLAGSETLATVTGRGATTSVPITVTASEGREVAVYMPSSYTTDDLVSGHEYGWYNDHWRLGMTRSGGAAGADFVVQWNGARRLSLTNGGNFTVTGTISATNFSGSSSGTNTGDQTNISGNAGTVGGYAVSVAGTANTIPTRNASGYLIPENWIQLNGIYGLYSPTNNAHLRPNSGTYGPWLITGARNGWSGIEFDGLSNGNVSMMIGAASQTVGWHNNNAGWQFLWENGVAMVSTNAYGGGTLHTVLHTGNFNSYAPTLTGGGASGSWGISITGNAATASSVAWTNVSGRPTALSAFTNDTGFISNSSDAFPSIPRANFIVTLTAAEYAALSPKQADTLYVVV